MYYNVCTCVCVCVCARARAGGVPGGGGRIKSLKYNKESDWKKEQ
jgi:hypothetical protein